MRLCKTEHTDEAGQRSQSRRARRPRRQASEQCFTSAQFFAHARRQLISRPQVAQGLLGRASLLPLKWPGVDGLGGFFMGRTIPAASTPTL
jgi:hypothetical protein